MIWHSSDTASVIESLKSNKDTGLDSVEVLHRLEKYGKNEIHDFCVPSFWKVLLKRISDYTSIAVFALALIYYIVSIASDTAFWTEPFMIICILIANAFAGSFIKYLSLLKTNRLRNSHETYSTVIRDGVEQSIPSSNIVPGDILVLNKGDYISADGRILDSYVLICDEFSVNGETVPTEKTHDIILEDITPIANRVNMVYAGSYVQSGKATVIVTETAEYTAIGRAEVVEKQVENKTTPLHARIKNIARLSRIICTVSAVVVFVIGIIANIGNHEIGFETTVLRYLLLGFSVILSAIPDGLPTIFSTAVSFSALRLKNRNLTFINLPSAEAIGGASVICTDKTGVLTDDNNNLIKIYSGAAVTDLSKNRPNEAGIMLLNLALICSNLNESEHIERHSNSLELAIERACINATGVSKTDIDGIYPRLAELPFDSKRMLMTTVTVINSKPYAVVKGAPEVIVSKCTETDPEKLLTAIDSFADEGLQVLGIALKPLDEIPANPTTEELENGLVFVGLLGFDNPAEPECAKEIKECKSKHIRVVMITGDYKKTAVKVARELGIIEDDSQAIDHCEFSAMSDEELFNKVQSCSVFSRATPEDKLRIVKALKASGEQVLLTCDDVADLPSLSEADFGCALGKTAAHSVKASSDFIVDDNKFSTLTLALKESNRIFDGVLRNIKFVITSATIQIATLILGILVFGRTPIAAVSMIWLNLIVLLPTSIAFSSENSSSTLSLRRHESRELISLNSILSIALPSLAITVLTLVAYALGMPYGSVAAATLSFAVLSICSTVHSFTLSHTYTVFQKGTVRNLVMPVACLISLLLLLIVILTPFGSLLSLTTLNGSGWLFVLVSAVITLGVGELTKFITPKIKNI